MAGKYQVKTNGWNPKNTAWNPFQGIISKVGDNLYSPEGQMLKFKLQSFGHLMQRSDSLEKTLCWEWLKAGEEGDDRGWDGWMASLTQWTWVWASSGNLWRTGKPVCCSPWGCKELDMTEWLNNNNNNCI